MSSTDRKKAPSPSLRPKEELEQLLEAYKKEHPDRFVFGWETRTVYHQDIKRYEKNVPCIMIHRVEDFATVEIPDFVYRFSVLPEVTWEVETESLSQEEAEEEQDDSSQPKQPAPVDYCYFKSNVEKISGGAGLHSIAGLFQHVNFNHTLDVSQLVVSNVSDMSGAFADCFIKELTGLRDWYKGETINFKSGVPNIHNMFHRAKIETLDSMFPLVPFFRPNQNYNDGFNLFYDAEIGTIKDTAPWDNLPWDKLPYDDYNFSQGFFNNAIIPALGLDRNAEKQEENAMAFFHASPYLQNKAKEQELSLATIVSCYQLIEYSPKEKNVTTLEKWFQAYLNDPWEAKLPSFVFEDFLELYHKSNPAVFEYVLDQVGHVRIRKFFSYVWKKTASYQEATIVIPDFVYGFVSRAFREDYVQQVDDYLYDDTLHFKLGKNVRDLSHSFEKSTLAPHLVLDDWDTSKVIKMESMFKNAYYQSIRGFETFDTSQVTSMRDMFSGFNRRRLLSFSDRKLPDSFKNASLDGLENWNTSCVLDMGAMFSGSEIEALDLSKWNVENVNSFSHIFCGCHNLKQLNLQKWNLKNASRIDSVFSNCKEIESIDVSQWKLPKNRVFRGNDLFEGCSSLSTLDLSSWDVSCFQNLSGMFYNCKTLNFTNADEIMSDWDISNVTRMHHMFEGCGISFKNPRKIRDLWEKKKHPKCDVARAFHDMVYGKKNSAKEMEISDFMPNLNLHYELFTWADDPNTRKEDN